MEARPLFLHFLWEGQACEGRFTTCLSHPDREKVPHGRVEVRLHGRQQFVGTMLRWYAVVTATEIMIGIL